MYPVGKNNDQCTFISLDPITHVLTGANGCGEVEYYILTLQNIYFAKMTCTKMLSGVEFTLWSALVEWSGVHIVDCR